MPAIVERHPEGGVRDRGPDASRRGETRGGAIPVDARAGACVDLGLVDHVEFDDRFLPIDDIADLLAETDLFVTPYRELEQISSGALSFGIAAGCAVVSTPYWYAQDLLASGAGEIVPFDDPAALAEAVCRFIDEPERLAAARAEARRIGDELAWPSVAEATAAVLHEAVERAPRPPTAPAVDPSSSASAPITCGPSSTTPASSQHANGVIPNRASGYCVDDVARLAVVALELARRGDEQLWTSIVHRSLAFLQDASDPRAGMRNFMGYDRRWLDEPHVGDHVGRTVWALGEILSTAWVPAVVGPAARLLDALTGTLLAERVAANRRLRRARARPPRPRPARASTPGCCSSAR